MDILSKSTPEAEGVSSLVIKKLLEKLQTFEYVHNIVIVRHGKIIFEASNSPYQVNSQHHLFSITKSLTSLAFGLCFDDGLVKLDDKVLDFFPEIKPQNDSEKWAKMEVRHLLIMATGHGTCPLLIDGKVTSMDYLEAFFAARLIYNPGERFIYNSGATHVLSAIIERVAKQDMEFILDERIFDPLEIWDYEFDKSARGISIGGVGGYFSVVDLAKIGQLILQKGSFNGKQLISKKYIELATSFQMSNAENVDADWQQGYGFQFWRSRFDSFRADGACGQYIVILPKSQVVIAMNSGMDNMRYALNAIFDILLPELQDSPITSNNSDVNELQAVAKKWSLPKLENKIKVDWKEKSFELEDNSELIQKISFIKQPYGLLIKFELDNRTTSFKVGFGNFQENFILDFDNRVKKFAITGCFESETLLHVRTIDLGNIYIEEHFFHIDGAKFSWERKLNNQFLRTKSPIISQR